MKSMQLPLVAIFFMTFFYRAGGRGMTPSAPTPDPLLKLLANIAYERVNLPKRNLLCGERWFESGLISFLS